VSAAADEYAIPAPTAHPGRLFHPEHRRLVFGIVLTVLVVAFEAMAVATAMPIAVRELNGLPLYAWGFSAFMITALFGMVVAGEVCDQRGPLLPFLASGLCFGAGLVIAGTAIDMPVFILGRAVQGLGGGLNIVALYVVVARAFPEALRPRVFSVMSSAWVLPSIIGPAVSGWVAETLSWRLVFLGVLPLIVPALALILPNVRRLEGGTSDAVRRSGRKRLALAAAVGAALLQFAGQRIGTSENADAAAGSGAAGSIAITAAVVVVGLALLGPSLPRLLPPGSLRAARGLPTSVLMRGVLAGAFFGAEAFVPLMLVTQRGLSATLAGLALTGGALGWAVGSWYQGRPGTTLSRARLVQLGCALVAVGIGGLSLTVWPAVPAYLGALFWVISGMGMGLAMASLSVLVLELSPPADQGANSAALQVCDAIGNVMFIGAGGAIYAALHTTAGHDGHTFLVIYVIMATVAVVGTVLSPRLHVDRAPRVSLPSR
jgi:MFS family permease